MLARALSIGDVGKDKPEPANKQAANKQAANKQAADEYAAGKRSSAKKEENLLSF